ncbi:MAG TPA: peptidylprolyl isomerase [Vicinamibacterales bacterium]|jgi:homoserine O-acetyltransferase
MRTLTMAVVCTVAVSVVSLSGEGVGRSTAEGGSSRSFALQMATPPVYNVRLETTKGAIVIAVHRDWAPLGADRFRELVMSRYFDNSRFFRVVKGQWAQFGINGDPAVSKQWRTRTFPDDPNKQSVIRGRVAFAFKDPGGRTTQAYISLRDNSYQDAQGFAPFGEVVTGMSVADALYSEYGESSGGGIRAGKQDPLFDGGNAFLDREFPRLDKLLHAVVMP